METNESHCDTSQVKEREQFEAALVRLRFMKDRVSELRARCEMLRNCERRNPRERLCAQNAAEKSNKGGE